MEFEISKTLQILERTPSVIEALLKDLNEEWIMNNEGGDTWSPYVVTAHLLWADKTDWMPRIKKIIDEGSNKILPPFDRFGQFEDSKGKSFDDLIEEFKKLRQKNISQLKIILSKKGLLGKRGVHPEFGEVTLQQLLSTWAVHDLAHLSQITRVMAQQYKQEIGPWAAYISLMNRS